MLGSPGAVTLRAPGKGIPLITLGSTVTFYPDFLVWVGDDVLAVDTKGEHLLLKAAGRKLLAVRVSPGSATSLHIRFVSRGRFNEQVQEEDKEGFTLWSRREDGTLRAAHHDDLDAVVTSLSSQP